MGARIMSQSQFQTRIDTVRTSTASSEFLRDPLPLLARYAESMLWLARYMERIENLARLIDVNETFMRLRTVTNGWEAILEMNDDSDFYADTYGEVTNEQVIAFYIIDPRNPNSIVSMALAARENARTLRPLISTEMWIQLNVFTNFIKGLSARDIVISRLSALCKRIKQDCQTHIGITEGTLFRDQAWLFNQLGRQLERADQTTRLIDIKYHALMPGLKDVGSEIDESQWTAVLRSAAGYHAYRRLMPNAISPAAVVGFLLKNNGFPRSLTTCLRHTHHALSLLRADYGLRCASVIVEDVEQMQNIISGQNIETIILRGLHEFLSGMREEIANIQDEIATTFWPL
ncbi:alpha-E domain-containing protein [Gluconobacter wancherniae]|uniref:alpha-E domain-containing protein n=1 Tax=Gluconobacter wancherniae TaxID=1307955 RepID=UPI002010D509|nr:alpha-E domain-containing protein [Gluconobacter wancherniae]